MTTVPSILVVTEATYQNVERVLEAQGRGAGTFTYGVKLVATGTTHPVTHRMCQDMTATAELEAAWRAYADSGDLPDITGTWGVGGVISAADAQAAHVGLYVHSIAAGGEVPANWAASVKVAHGVIVQPEPDV